jgi:uncharacterized membrane-anchored protein
LRRPKVDPQVTADARALINHYGSAGAYEEAVTLDNNAKKREPYDPHWDEVGREIARLRTASAVSTIPEHPREDFP